MCFYTEFYFYVKYRMAPPKKRKKSKEDKKREAAGAVARKEIEKISRLSNSLIYPRPHWKDT
jgi:hypothetical protein